MRQFGVCLLYLINLCKYLPLQFPRTEGLKRGKLKITYFKVYNNITFILKHELQRKKICYLGFLEDPIEIAHLPCKQKSRHLSLLGCDSLLQQTYSKCISAMLQYLQYLPKGNAASGASKLSRPSLSFLQPFFFLIFVVFADFLVMHLQELVRMVFISATAICDQLKLAGLSTLQVH